MIFLFIALPLFTAALLPLIGKPSRRVIPDLVGNGVLLFLLVYAVVAGRSLRLEGRAAWINAKTTRAVDPAEVGKRTTNVAPFAASLAASWQVPAAPGFELNNRLNYSGRKPVNADNSVELPSYWQWDISLAYRWLRSGTRMTLAAGIDNVTDRRYWREAPTQYWGGVYLFPAQPLSARVSLAADW